MLALHAERSKRVEHDARIVGIEQVRDRRLAFGQRGQQQHAVGDALGAGQSNRAVSAGKRSKIEVVHDRVLFISGRDRRACGRHRGRGRLGPRRARCQCAARLARARKDGFERRAVCGNRSRRASVRAPPCRRRALRASAVRFAKQTSRHISGLDAAIRVKSRKPPAANENLSAASGRSKNLLDERVRQHVRQMAHRREHAVVLVCVHRSELQRRPRARVPRRVATSSSRFSGRGQSTTLRST